MNKLVFKSKKAALDFLSSVEGLRESVVGQVYYPAGIYHLAHGEYVNPFYTTRRYKDGWGIHVKYSFYAGTFGTPSDGRIDPETFFDRFPFQRNAP